MITATITVSTDQGHRSEVYRLVTTILDPDCPATEIVALYHQRWEIETAFFELKSTILGGRVLRSRTPTGVEQEIYALLVTYQALRIAISDATLAEPKIDPDRGSFSVALNTARDQLTAAAGVITITMTGAVVDLVGMIGHQVLSHLIPARRSRNNPRVVKRAISVYAANTARGRARAPSRNTTITITHGEP